VEKDFRYELASIPGFIEKTFPITAPEKTSMPYMSYMLNPGVRDRTLTSVLDSKRVDGAVEVVCSSYSALHDALDAVVSKLSSFTQRSIGGTSTTFVTESIVDDQTREYFDDKTGKYRGIVEFSIYL
jgi:hypothetical protein